MQAAFCFSDGLLNAQFRQSALYDFQKNNQNQPSANVQAAFIPAAALRHYTPNTARSGRLKRVYTSKSSLR